MAHLCVWVVLVIAVVQDSTCMHKTTLQDKRARICNLRRGAYSTTRAAAKLLKAARDDGVPEHISETTQHRYRRALCARETPYGQLVQDMQLPSGVSIGFQHPLAMLDVAVQESESLARCISDAIDEYGQPSPDTPWRLVWYCDEIGISPLAHHDAKKSWGCYWSFVEFGRRLLCNENLWFVMAAVRSDLVSAISGGISHLTKLFLHMFLTSGSGNLRTGICLHLAGSNAPIILFAELHLIASDLDAVFKMMCSLGAKANVPCPFCTNIVSFKSGWAAAGNALRPLDCTNNAEIICHTDVSIRKCLTDLRAAARDYRIGNMSKGDFEAMQQDLGYKHNDHNLLLDEHLNVHARSVMHLDWFHIYMQTGLFNYEFAALITFLLALRPQVITIQTFREFVASYTPPRHLGATLAQLFHANCISKDSVHFKCSASEAWTLYPIIAVFMAEVVLPLGVCVPQVGSFLALCDALDMLVHVQEGIVTPQQLKDSIEKHLGMCKAAYGDLFWAYKHHAAAAHLWEQFARHGLLISLFTQERRHKLPKRYIKDRRKLTGFERGVIEEITLQHLFDLQSDLVRTGLHEPREPRRLESEALFSSFPDASSFKVSTTCSLSNGSVAKVGDAVAFRYGNAFAVGELWTIFHIARIDGTSDDAVCITMWRPMPTASRCYKNFTMDEQPTFVLVDHVLAPLHVSKNVKANVASCIVPAPLQDVFGQL